MYGEDLYYEVGTAGTVGTVPPPPGTLPPPAPDDGNTVSNRCSSTVVSNSIKCSNSSTVQLNLLAAQAAAQAAAHHHAQQQLAQEQQFVQQQQTNNNSNNNIPIIMAMQQQTPPAGIQQHQQLGLTTPKEMGMQNNRLNAGGLLQTGGLQTPMAGVMHGGLETPMQGGLQTPIKGGLHNPTTPQNLASILGIQTPQNRTGAGTNLAETNGGGTNTNRNDTSKNPFSNGFSPFDRLGEIGSSKKVKQNCSTTNTINTASNLIFGAKQATNIYNNVSTIKAPETPAHCSTPLGARHDLSLSTPAAMYHHLASGGSLPGLSAPTPLGSLPIGSFFGNNSSTVGNLNSNSTNVPSNKNPSYANILSNNTLSNITLPNSGYPNGSCSNGSYSYPPLPLPPTKNGMTGLQNPGLNLSGQPGLTLPTPPGAIGSRATVSNGGLSNGNFNANLTNGGMSATGLPNGALTGCGMSATGLPNNATGNSGLGGGGLGGSGLPLNGLSPTTAASMYASYYNLAASALAAAAPTYAGGDPSMYTSIATAAAQAAAANHAYYGSAFGTGLAAGFNNTNLHANGVSLHASHSASVTTAQNPGVQDGEHPLIHGEGYGHTAGQNGGYAGVAEYGSQGADYQTGNADYTGQYYGLSGAYNSSGLQEYHGLGIAAGGQNSSQGLAGKGVASKGDFVSNKGGHHTSTVTTHQGQSGQQQLGKGGKHSSVTGKYSAETSNINSASNPPGKSSWNQAWKPNNTTAYNSWKKGGSQTGGQSQSARQAQNPSLQSQTALQKQYAEQKPKFAEHSAEHNKHAGNGGLDVAGKGALGKFTFDKGGSGKNTPGKWTPLKNTPLKNTPLKNAPAKNTPLKNAFGTVLKNTPLKRNAAEMTVGKSTPPKKGERPSPSKVSWMKKGAQVQTSLMKNPLLRSKTTPNKMSPASETSKGEKFKGYPLQTMKRSGGILMRESSSGCETSFVTEEVAVDPSQKTTQKDCIKSHLAASPDSTAATVENNLNGANSSPDICDMISEEDEKSGRNAERDYAGLANITSPVKKGNDHYNIESPIENDIESPVNSAKKMDNQSRMEKMDNASLTDNAEMVSKIDKSTMENPGVGTVVELESPFERLGLRSSGEKLDLDSPILVLETPGNLDSNLGSPITRGISRLPKCLGEGSLTTLVMPSVTNNNFSCRREDLSCHALSAPIIGPAKMENAAAPRIEAMSKESSAQETIPSKAFPKQSNPETTVPNQPVPEEIHAEETIESPIENITIETSGNMERAIGNISSPLEKMKSALDVMKSAGTDDSFKSPLKSTPLRTLKSTPNLTPNFKSPVHDKNANVRTKASNAKTPNIETPSGKAQYQTPNGTTPNGKSEYEAGGNAKTSNAKTPNTKLQQQKSGVAGICSNVGTKLRHEKSLDQKATPPKKSPLQTQSPFLRRTPHRSSSNPINSSGVVGGVVPSGVFRNGTTIKGKGQSTGDVFSGQCAGKGQNLFPHKNKSPQNPTPPKMISQHFKSPHKNSPQKFLSTAVEALLLSPGSSEDAWKASKKGWKEDSKYVGYTSQYISKQNHQYISKQNQNSTQNANQGYCNQSQSYHYNTQNNVQNSYNQNQSVYNQNNSYNHNQNSYEQNSYGKTANYRNSYTVNQYGISGNNPQYGNVAGTNPQYVVGTKTQYNSGNRVTKSSKSYNQVLSCYSQAHSNFQSVKAYNSHVHFFDYGKESREELRGWFREPEALRATDSPHHIEEGRRGNVPGVKDHYHYGSGTNTKDHYGGGVNTKDHYSTGTSTKEYSNIIYKGSGGGNYSGSNVSYGGKYGSAGGNYSTNNGCYGSGAVNYGGTNGNYGGNGNYCTTTNSGSRQDQDYYSGQDNYYSTGAGKSAVSNCTASTYSNNSGALSPSKRSSYSTTIGNGNYINGGGSTYINGGGSTYINGGGSAYINGGGSTYNSGYNSAYNISAVAQGVLERVFLPWLREKATDLFLFSQKKYEGQRGGVVFIFNNTNDIESPDWKSQDWKYMPATAVGHLAMKTNHILSALQKYDPETQCVVIVLVSEAKFDRFFFIHPCDRSAQVRKAGPNPLRHNAPVKTTSTSTVATGTASGGTDTVTSGATGATQPNGNANGDENATSSGTIHAGNGNSRKSGNAGLPSGGMEQEALTEGCECEQMALTQGRSSRGKGRSLPIAVNDGSKSSVNDI